MSERLNKPKPLIAPPTSAFASRPFSLTSGLGSGQTLDKRTNAEMSAKFGHDFSSIRIHTNARSGDAAESMGANAYALGGDIVFGAGKYQPGSRETDRLLAHELTHVVQQSQFGPGDWGRVSQKGDANEREADGLASEVMMGQSVSVQAAPGAAVAREETDPVTTSLGSVMGVANEATGGLLPMLGAGSKLLGAAGSAQKGITADGAADTTSGVLGAAGGITEFAKYLGETGETLGEGVLGGLGTAAGALGFAQTGADTYSDFSKGNFGTGALDLLKGTGQGISTAASASGFSLFGAGGVGAAAATLGGAWTAGGLGGVAGTVMPTFFGGSAGAAALPGVAGMDAGAALAGGGAEGLAALGPAGAVIGAGVAGVEAGKGLDSLSNMIGQKITGDDKGDYSFSNGLAHGMTALDNALDGGKAGKGLADLFTPTVDASGKEDSFTDRLGKLF